MRELINQTNVCLNFRNTYADIQVEVVYIIYYMCHQHHPPVFLVLLYLLYRFMAHLSIFYDKGRTLDSDGDYRHWHWWSYYKVRTQIIYLHSELSNGFLSCPSDIQILVILWHGNTTGETLRLLGFGESNVKRVHGPFSI